MNSNNLFGRQATSLSLNENFWLEKRVGNLRLVSVFIKGHRLFVVTSLNQEIVQTTSGDVCAFYDRDLAIKFLESHFETDTHAPITNAKFDDYLSAPGSIH